MSATFKNAKKLVKQEQLRKIMKEHKKGSKEVKKIDSPLAKYNELGQLTCVLCKSVVKSEAVWVVHINAKQHKQNIEIAKKLKEKTNNFTTPLKRPLTPPLPDVPEKKIKGILKNAPKTVQSVTHPPKSSDEVNGESSNFGEPSQFSVSVQNKESTSDGSIEQGNIEQDASSVLPEGFFDDPILDAKARHQEYKDPLEVEWEKFLKEMKVVEDESEAIIAEDQDESTAERHIEEIDEQMLLFNRVLDLEKKKDEAIVLLNKIKSEPRTEEEEVDEDVEEFLDWRQKTSY